MFRKFWKSEGGSVTVEFVIAVPFLVGLAAIANDLGNSLRASAVLEVAVRDTSRVLSMVPFDNDTGNLHQAGVDRAFQLFLDRVEETNINVDLVTPGGFDPNTQCAPAGFPCVTMVEVDGSRALFGEPRYNITVAAAMETDTPLLMLLGMMFESREERENKYNGLTLTASNTLLHFRDPPDDPGPAPVPAGGGSPGDDD